jgi:beta-glucanase (GH16 family)
MAAETEFDVVEASRGRLDRWRQAAVEVGGALLLTATVALTGCSGGGEDGTVPETTVPPDTTEEVAPTTTVRQAAETTTTTTPEVADVLQPVWEWDPSQPLETQWNIATPAYETHNNEEQVYMNRPENVRVENNVLVLEAHQEGGEISSGLISTEGMVAFGPGSRFEASLKLPKGQGVWPAFWMLSETQPYTQGLSDAEWATPVKNSAGKDRERYLENGEIDIMEYYGHTPGMVEATVHTVESSPEGHRTVADAQEAFHTYALEWHAGPEEKLVWLIDDVPYHTFEKTAEDTHSWPFTDSNQMFIIINLAMGGDGGGDIVSRPGDSWRMDVASVKVTQLAA